LIVAFLTHINPLNPSPFQKPRQFLNLNTSSRRSEPGSALRKGWQRLVYNPTTSDQPAPTAENQSPVIRRGITYTGGAIATRVVLHSHRLRSASTTIVTALEHDITSRSEAHRKEYCIHENSKLKREEEEKEAAKGYAGRG
jgi:hypothetical protein